MFPDHSCSLVIGNKSVKLTMVGLHLDTMMDICPGRSWLDSQNCFYTVPQEEVELSHRVVSRSAVRPSLAGLPLGALMSVSLSGTLHCQECSWIAARRLQPSIRILQDIWKCRNSVSCQISEATVLLTNYSWEGLEWSIGLFQVLWGYKWKCLPLGPWTCRTVCKMKVEGSEAHLQSSFRICSQTKFSCIASKGP